MGDRKSEHPFGVVMLKEWMNNPETGQQVLNVAGPIKLVTAKEAWNLIPKGNETNWAIHVGEDNRNVLILGCQIRAIYYGKAMKTFSNNCWDLT